MNFHYWVRAFSVVESKQRNSFVKWTFEWKKWFTDSININLFQVPIRVTDLCILDVLNKCGAI